MVFHGIAIDCAAADILNIDANKLAEYYLMRAQAYTQQGKKEQARLDMQKVIEADPNFMK